MSKYAAPNREADALERIAAALEKIAVQKPSLPVANPDYKPWWPSYQPGVVYSGVADSGINHGIAAHLQKAMER